MASRTMDLRVATCRDPRRAHDAVIVNDCEFEDETVTPPRELDCGARRSFGSGSPEADDFRSHACGAPEGLHQLSRNHPRDTVMLAAAMEDILRRNLVDWGEALLKLQPKVLLSRHLLECGLWLFKCARRHQCPPFPRSSRMAGMPRRRPSSPDGVLLRHDLAAALWIALKHCSVRTAVPNRALLARATGARPELLQEREVASLRAVDWRINAALRSADLVGEAYEH